MDGSAEGGWWTYQVVQQLLADDLDHLERGLGGNRVDKHIAMDANEVLAVHDAVLILPSTQKVNSQRRSIAGQGNGCAQLTCPAVSIISVENSWPLYFITLEKVFSMVG